MNVVHVRRCSPVHPKHLKRQAEALGLGFGVQAVALTRDARPASQRLTAALSDEQDVRPWLADDIAACIALLGSELGYERVRAKLEVLGGTPCPRWHADHVGVRLLVTYAGPGTWYVENRHVQRRWLWRGEGGVAVGPVDEAAGVQAGACDLLLLKGHGWPGNYGLGAVHKSPDVGPGGRDGPRLLLTVDDVLPAAGREEEDACGCGGVHGAGDAGHMADASLAA